MNFVEFKNDFLENFSDLPIALVAPVLFVDQHMGFGQHHEMSRVSSLPVRVVVDMQDLLRIDGALVSDIVEAAGREDLDLVVFRLQNCLNFLEFRLSARP